MSEEAATPPSLLAGEMVVPAHLWAELVAGTEAIEKALVTTNAVLGAVQSLSEAAGELARFAREGAIGESFAFAEDTIRDVVRGLVTIIEIERPYIAKADRVEPDPQGVDLLDDLNSDLARFLVDWA